MVRARKSTGKKMRLCMSKSPLKVRASKRTSKKKMNSWLKFIMKYSKDNNMSLKEALSSKSAREQYRKSK